LKPNTRLIDPLADLGSLLLGVEKPARYVGGEYGRLSTLEADLHLAIAFPDLYEIGMSNQALRILYKNLNALDGVSCDRVFAPAPDFEALLSRQLLSLYTLDHGLPLKSLDMLGFSLGYELGITGVLSILQSAFIPLRSQDRTEADPLVIMGGPAASNPLPFGKFMDAVWLGEAEPAFFELIGSLASAKRQGATRADLLALLVQDVAVWIPGKKARRALDVTFAERGNSAAVLPVPSMKIIQDHGSVEIMRGCPNGCRFCHAGVWYRPMRQKSIPDILAEVSTFVALGGYREITLSSLSTGDYHDIHQLVSLLNAEYADRHISFQLPSLKVSSFSLPLIASISQTRKSGLTFAVETPVEAWQMSINKPVSRDAVAAILSEAKRQGWRSAKFYFMIGLPVGDYRNGFETNREEEEIVDFLKYVYRKSGMSLHVNVGAFVPKPHTPYQWAPQIPDHVAQEKLYYIRSHLKPLGFKIGTHDPFVSKMEGVLSRGDERVGDLIEAAFNRGCRLDAWDDFVRKDVWAELFDANADLIASILGPQDLNQPLPWDSIDSGVGKGFLKKEFAKSERSELTSICTDDCKTPCGVCHDDRRIVENSIHPPVDSTASAAAPGTIVDKVGVAHTHDQTTHRILFSYKKVETAVFIAHLSLVEVFAKAFVRAGLPIAYSEGFNPLPRLDFASSLSVGISALAEVATVDTESIVETEEFLAAINRVMPQGLFINRAYGVSIPVGTKKRSVSSVLWGFTYGQDLVAAKDEKQYRLEHLAPDGSIYGLERNTVLAKNPEGNPVSYFDLYKQYYGKVDRMHIIDSDISGKFNTQPQPTNLQFRPLP